MEIEKKQEKMKKGRIIREVPYRIIDNLYHNPGVSISKIAKISDVTYSHVVKFFQALQEKRLVLFFRTGRECRYELTDLGKNVAKELIKLYKLLHG